MEPPTGAPEVPTAEASRLSSLSVGHFTDTSGARTFSSYSASGARVTSSASSSKEPPQVASFETPMEAVSSVDPLSLDLPAHQFLDQFELPSEGSTIVIDTRALLTGLDRLGYVLNEELPPQERPDQRNMSLLAYLQVTLGVSDRIAVLDLAEFNQLLTESIQKRFPWFRQAGQGRGLTADELLEHAHRIVRDPAGVLRHAPTVVSAPQLGPFMMPPPSMPELLQNLTTLMAKQAELTQPKPAVPKLRLHLKPPVAPPVAAPGESVTQDLPELPSDSEEDVSSSLRSTTLPIEESASERDSAAPATPRAGKPQASPAALPKSKSASTKSKQTERGTATGSQRKLHGSKVKRPRLQPESSPPMAAPPDPSASTPAPRVEPMEPIETTSKRGGPRRSAAIQSELQRRTATAQPGSSGEESEQPIRSARKSKTQVSSGSSSEGSKAEEGEEASEGSCVMLPATAAKSKSKKAKSGSATPPARPKSRGATAAAAKATPEPAPQVPDDWKRIPKTVAIPGRRDAMREKDKHGHLVKSPVRVFKASQLSGRVDAIWTDLDHGIFELFVEAFAPIKTRWDAIHGHLMKIDAARTRRFLSEIQWKLFANFPRNLWKCYGLRLANPEEKAAYNLMAHLPRDVVPIKRLTDKARKEIGESADYLDASDENTLLPRDIWSRLIRELDGLEDFEHRLLALEGRSVTAIVCSGLPNACAVYKLLNEYAKEAAGEAGEMHSIELSNGGTLLLARLAQDVVSWHFGVEELVTEALDLDSIGRSARVGTHQTFGSLDHYLGEAPYPVERDIDLVECSCRADILAKLRGALLPSSLGIQANKWRTNEATKFLRLPVLLSLGACSSAYSPKGPADKDELERFIAAFKELVHANGVDYNADPKPLEDTLSPDRTLDRDAEELLGPIDSLGPVRFNSTLLDMSAYLPGGVRLAVRNGLVVVSRIALLKPTTARPHYKPHVVTLVLANGFGRPIVICDSGPQDALIPAGVVDYGGRRTTQAEMRRLLLQHLAANNVLVGFHVGWTLAALELVLPATRVVDLGTEDIFQTWCRHMAAQLPGWRDALAERLVNSYDRRIPAVLFQGGIELRPAGVDDTVRETYYLAAIWGAVAAEIGELRSRPEVHFIKSATPVGAGNGITEEESPMLYVDRNLVARANAPDLAELQCTATQLSDSLDVAPTDTVRWEYDMAVDPFFKQCVALAAEGAKAPKVCKPFRTDFGDHKERCQIAVQVALPSLAVTGSANLFLPWINHSSGLTVAELRAINIMEPRIRSRVGRRLFSCWLDFAVRPAEFTAASNTQGQAPTGRVVPPQVSTAEAPAPAVCARPSTPPLRAPAVTATTPAPTPAPVLTPATPQLPPVHQPVSLPPVADWLPQTRERAVASTGAGSGTTTTAPASTRSLPTSPRPGRAAPAPRGPVEPAPTGEDARVTRSRARASPRKDAAGKPHADEDV